MLEPLANLEEYEHHHGDHKHCPNDEIEVLDVLDENEVAGRIHAKYSGDNGKWDHNEGHDGERTHDVVRLC